MADKTVAEKMRIKPGSRIVLLHAPDGAADLISAADPTYVDSPEETDVVALFVNSQAEVEERLASLTREVNPSTAVWIIYPKGSRAAGLDISRDTIWPVAEALGMRPVSIVSVNDTLSAFRVKTGE